jgi:hypothetical protein
MDSPLKPKNTLNLDEHSRQNVHKGPRSCHADCGKQEGVKQI